MSEFSYIKEASVMKGNQLLFISAKTLSDAWVAAMRAVLFTGKRMRTEYNDEDELSFDLTATIEVRDPTDTTPHRGDVYAWQSINKAGYKDEILLGTKDDQVGKGPSYPYTYHNRIFAYKPYSLEDLHKNNPILVKRRHHKVLRFLNTIDCASLNFPPVDQVKYMIKKLKEAPYTRRAQGITWRPYSDPYFEDCPCLQRIWCRVVDGKLGLQVDFRSRDLFRAWQANAVGILYIQQYIAEQLGVPQGTYVDHSNSLHIYGKKKDITEVIQFFETWDKRESKNARPGFSEFEWAKFNELKEECANMRSK
jgi:thymidylate synthase (methanogen type)